VSLKFNMIMLRDRWSGYVSWSMKDGCEYERHAEDRDYMRSVRKLQIARKHVILARYEE
jgi:hypothetical protein